MSCRARCVTMVQRLVAVGPGLSGDQTGLGNGRDGRLPCALGKQRMIRKSYAKRCRTPDVTERDGLQALKTILPSHRKLALIRDLTPGLRSPRVASFVSQNGTHHG